MEKNVGAYGVTYDEFWYGNMGIVAYKISAFKSLQELEMMKTDIFAWSIGSYVLDAIATAFSKSHRYPQQPKCKNKPKTPEQKAVEQFNRLEQWRRKTANTKLSG